MDQTQKYQAMHGADVTTTSSIADKADGDLNNAEKIENAAALNLKLDSRGLPLVPQPCLNSS